MQNPASKSSSFRWLPKAVIGLLLSLALLLPVPTARAAAVDTIANPANTTMDVFDYWVYDNSGNSSTANSATGGINVGHDLWFWGSTNATHGAYNNWTGSGNGAYQGIVQRQLVGGYPVLAVDNQQSLAYLFDRSDIDVTVANNRVKPAKRTYANANELFTVDEDGYYLFDSDIHKAVLNTDTGEFSVTTQSGGEFYPVSSNSNTDKYFFGLHMQAEFSVPNDGLVLNHSGEYREMVYEFSGDDDVWVFIDGILIGDVGGIHDAQNLSINFATGEVVVKNHANGNHVHRTTIYDMVVAAIGAEAAQARFRWKVEDDGSIRTYASGTYHTMDFFYLERGAGKSNMKIKYNLISTYDFTAHKTLYRGGDADAQPLQENQFRYRLTGYPITDQNGNTILAVMPRSQPDQDVYWSPDYGGSVRTLEVGNSADGNVNFGNADLTGEELALYVGKTFRYVYEELPPEGVEPDELGNYVKDGILYDSHKFYFEGTISPEGWINKTYYTDDTYTTRANVNFVNFTNLYNSTGRALLAARKQYLQSDGKLAEVAQHQFGFRLTNVTDPAAPVVLETDVGNDGSGKVTFAQLLYSLANDLREEDFGPDEARTRTYTYLIEELPGEDADTIYSTESYYARVTLSDDGDGSLVVETAYYADADCTQERAADEVVFTNLRVAADVRVPMTKILEGRDMEAGEFTFTLVPLDPALDGVGLGGAAALTIQNEAAYSGEPSRIVFPEMSFTRTDYINAGRKTQDGAAVFYYLVSEERGEAPGVTYSGDRYLVRVALRLEDEDTRLVVDGPTYYFYDGTLPDEFAPAGEGSGGA